MNAGVVKALLVAQVGGEALLLHESGMLKTYKCGRQYVQPRPIKLAASVRWFADRNEQTAAASESPDFEYGPKYSEWLRWVAGAVEMATKP